MTDNKENSANDPSKRDFIVLAASGVAAVGAACSVWPLVDSLNPSADVLAMSSIEVDIGHIQPGQALTVKWRGKPVFIRRRTKAEIDKALATPLAELKDPQTDEERVKKGHEEWLVLIGICTHLGCVPLDHQGDYGGWFCPCHGSQYDTSGRIRKGPAPTNLEVPAYTFVSDTKIKIG